MEQLQEITQRAQGQGFEAALAAMRELFPPELHADIRPAAEYLVPSLAKEKP